MSFNIDIAIFAGFLLITLVFGLYHSRGIHDIKEYAVGNRNFSTATLVATLIATWVSGESFFSYLSDSYSNGLYAIWAYVLGEVSCFLIMGYFFAPRLGEFFGTISIADAMGNLFGNNVRIITAISGVIGICGLIAIQLKISGLLFEYCFGIDSVYGIFIGGSIITLYSVFGGIKSVTFTDVLQFFTFGITVPIIAYYIASTLDNINVITTTLTINPLFNYHQVFDFTRAKSLSYLFIFFFIAIPGFGPAIFQRMVMAQNVIQVRKSLIISGIGCLFLGLMMSWIGILIISTVPNIEASDVVKHVLLNSYSVIGLKGLILTGILAMVMSTVDSYVNSASILIVHDFFKPLGLKIKNELLLAKWTSLLIGSVAMIVATLSSGNLMHLFIVANMFYMPIVTIPFVMALLGFRSTSKSVLIGIGAGFITVIIWEMFLKSNVGNIDSILPGMAANLIALLLSHYILKQEGGWVGIKDTRYLLQLRHERKRKIYYIMNSIKNFDLSTFLHNNCPKNENMYVYLGIFCIISILSSINGLPKEIHNQYHQIINIIYPSSLFISTLLISYPLWLESWKEKNIPSIFWNITIFYILCCIGLFSTIISNFGSLQLITLMVNMLIIAVLVKWQLALLMIVSGFLLTTQFFIFYSGIGYLPTSFIYTQAEVTYLILLISSILIIFLKPKQAEEELTTEKNHHLNGKINIQQKQAEEAWNLRSEFIRNISHEYHAPLTGIKSMSQTLWESYEKLTNIQRKKAAETIFKSSLRLESFDTNIRILSKLSQPNYELKLDNIDFSNLVYDRIEICRKFYEKNKESREFIFDIEEDIVVNCDKDYMIQVLDNLIINAINYCPQGKITVSLKQDDTNVNFSISDKGIGIPINELYDIFAEFTVSSRTHTPAGGRGIGLTLCKRIIEVHGGAIKAESDGTKGAKFIVSLPKVLNNDDQ